ncbi:hypothetical protein, partial [Acinetobacter nosocomialis]|uniref:hypothetical protein n=1 Tax=Acinetobacter nosocomialis TaxID=106654 RepID=UPI001C084555
LYCIPEGTTSLDRVRTILKSAQAPQFVRAHSGRLESGYLDIRIGTVRRIPTGQDLISSE